MDWYKPDETWKALGVENRNDFVDNYVVLGKFHNDVPEDIVKSFETISYLMAHSYYHYPMYDEAMSKALLVMEMAVKLKAKKLNISLDKQTKNNKTLRKKLGNLINELFENEQLKFLKPDFDRARNFRNYKMHPDQYTITGVMGRTDGNIMLFINVLNQLFLDKNSVKNLINKRRAVEEVFKSIKKGLFVFECHKGRLLIDIIHLHKYFCHGDKELLLLFVNPLIESAYKRLSKHKFNQPLVVCLTEFEVTDNAILGKEDNGHNFKMYPTKKIEHLEVLKGYYSEIEKVSERDMDMFIQFSGHQALWEMERKIYENCWVDKN